MFIVVNFDALAMTSDFRIEGKQVVFLCWMQDSNPEGLWNRISGRLNARWQTDWAIEDQAKISKSTARPYNQRAFSPLDPTAGWHSHLALAIYMFVVVNFKMRTVHPVNQNGNRIYPWSRSVESNLITLWTKATLTSGGLNYLGN